MRYFGLSSSGVLYLILLILTYSVSKYFLYNTASFELNLIGIVALSSLFYLLVMPNYIAKPGLTLVVYSLATVVILNFLSSSLIDVFEKGLDDNDATGMSWIIIVPATLIAGIIWGWIFDRQKNKIIKP